jgi:hypothetical protein
MKSLPRVVVVRHDFVEERGARDQPFAFNPNEIGKARLRRHGGERVEQIGVEAAEFVDLLDITPLAAIGSSVIVGQHPADPNRENLLPS